VKYQSGEIYFIREQGLDGKLTDFVKIGLVKSPRTSEQRLDEHQTGNPRKLVLTQGHVVYTEAVSLVEAQLHRRFATERIGGEWFKFEHEAKLKSAIESTTSLATEVGHATPLLVRADELKDQNSNSLTVPATPDALAQAHLLVAGKEKEKALKALNVEIKDLLTSVAKAGGDLGTSATLQRKSFKAKFDEAKFLIDYPEIASKYFIEEPVWAPRFLVKYKLPTDFEFDPIFQAEVKAIRDLLPLEGQLIEASQLEEPSLRLTQLEAIVDWETTLAEARLKIECGMNEAIEGICTWKREASSKRVFDTEAFLGKEYELYKEYLLDEVTREYVIPAKGSKRK